MSGGNDGQHELRADMDDEIDLLELWRTLLKYKRLILLVTFGVAIVAAGVSLLMPNIYRAEVLLAPANTDDAKGGGLSAALGGLGGLASMAGISVGGGGSTEQNLAVLKSRDFLWKFVQEKKLMPILFEDKWDEQQKKWKETDPKKQPGQLDAHRLLINGILSVDRDKKTDLVTVSVELKDAALAAEVANSLVEQLNLYLAQQSITRSESNLQYLNEELMRTQIEEMRKILFDLIATEQKKVMLANTQKDFAFKVLDKAVEPDKKIKPKRSLIVILSALVAAFLTIIYIFFKEGIAKRRDEESKAKAA